MAADLLGIAAAGILFLLGSLMVTESPRWLFRRGKEAQALAVLLRSRTAEQAGVEMEEMRATALEYRAPAATVQMQFGLLRRKYVAPFLIACAILFLNQTTGINSIIATTPIFCWRAGSRTCWLTGDM